MMKRVHSFATYLIAFATLGPLSACTGNLLQSKTPEPQAYMLRVTAAPTATVAYSAQLAVALPSATPGLNTSHIAVLRNGNELDYFYGARWGANAPQVVQAFLVSLLQAQQGYKGVISEGMRVDADYLLEVELRDFQAEYRNADADTTPTVHVNLVGTLVDIHARKTLGQLHAETTVAAADNRLNAVVNAFQAALQQASVQLSGQVAASIQQQP